MKKSKFTKEQIVFTLRQTESWTRVVEVADLIGVVIHADDIQAEFLETGARDQADISGADDGN